MSVVGPRGRILTMVAVGVLGAGCGTAEPQQGAAEPQQEELPRQSTPQSSSPGWSATGIMLPGTVNSDELNDVVVEPSTGNVLVAGYENGLLGMASVDPSGNARGIIMRYDSNLFLLDKISIDSSLSAEVVEALALSPSSQDIYFTGRTTGSFNATPNAGQFDTLAGWVDATNSKKIFQFGHQRPEHPVRLAVDPNGALIVSGHTDTYIPSNYVEAWEDPFVLKLNRGTATNGTPTLTPAWEVLYNTSASDVLPGLTVDSSANIYVSGANPNGTSRGMYVKQLTPSGATGWYSQQSIVSLDMAAALSISPLDGNNLLMAGSTYALLGKQQFGQQDAVVRMLDKNTRAILWTQQFGSAESEWVTDMTQDAQGNIYVVGETLGSVDPLVQPQGDYDIFVIKLDSNGLNPQVFQIGSSMDDHPSAVAVDANGTIYVVGYSSGSLFQGQTNKGSHDAFLLKLVPPGSGGIGI
ncbi:MAG: SBBP repeat-containing protein [Hyalangium sp.]